MLFLLGVIKRNSSLQDKGRPSDFTGFFFNQLNVWVFKFMGASFEMMWFNKISLFSWSIFQSIQGSKTQSLSVNGLLNNI